MEDCLRQASLIALLHAPPACQRHVRLSHYLASQYSFAFTSLAHVLTFAELVVTSTCPIIMSETLSAFSASMLPNAA